MKDSAGEPENDTAPPNTTQCSHDEAYHFFPGRPLPISKGPIFIQEKTIDSAQTIGQRAVSQDYRNTVGGKQQQQKIQNQQVHESIQSANQTKAQHLPEPAFPARITLKVGVSFVMVRLNGVENFNRFSPVDFRSFYHKHILSKKCVALNADEQMNPVFRRCRFIAHTADSSALGGFTAIRIILFISI